GEELKKESSKKQKMDEDIETNELKGLMKVIANEEGIAIDAIPLATKSPSIVDWKIVTEGKKSFYLIIRVGGQFKRPEGRFKRVLWGDLKTMFEPHVEDEVWKLQQ
ncbi:hypothetical protein Tco_0148295, partial [Tanacetum coccineum]